MYMQAIGVIVNAYVRKGKVDDQLFTFISKTVQVFRVCEGVRIFMRHQPVVHTRPFNTLHSLYKRAPHLQKHTHYTRILSVLLYIQTHSTRVTSVLFDERIMSVLFSMLQCAWM